MILRKSKTTKKKPPKKKQNEKDSTFYLEGLVLFI